jgi:uncharacterized protein
MSVTQPDYASAPRGRSDAARHRQKLREAIRQNLPDIISDEAIITRKENKLVKVPIRGIKSYHFVHGRMGDADAGFGSGETEKGKVVGQRPKPGQGKPGRPGDEPGVDYLETEIEIEELIAMMLDDLGLPNLQKKEVREAFVSKGWKIDSVEKSGIRPRLDKLRTVKEAIYRNEVLVAQLMRQTGRTEADCRNALALCRGDAATAARMLGEGTRIPSQEGQPPIILGSADLRYRTLAEDTEAQSNAVVMAMMDVSGSMDTMKKYLARSFFFWMVSFLKTVYRQVDIRFIAHTTEAKLVDEEEFFHKGESGGTECASAYELAASLIDTAYPTDRWNVYPFHFSDGEDWGVERSVQALKNLLSKGVATFGYGEIQAEYSSSTLLQAFQDSLSLQEHAESGLRYYEGTWGSSPFIGVVVQDKKDLYPVLKVLLRPE